VIRDCVYQRLESGAARAEMVLTVFPLYNGIPTIKVRRWLAIL
jgi:hypothetical protein